MQSDSTGFLSTCLQCGVEFRSSRSTAKRCSTRCRNAYAAQVSRERQGLPADREWAICPQCQVGFWKSRTHHRYCTELCQRAAYVGARIGDEYPVSLSRGTFGALAELKAAADLMARGFHVFRAMSPSCPCDLVVWRPGGAVIRVEVKSATKNMANGHLNFQKAPRNVFDALCHVAPDEIIYIPPISDW